MLYNNKIFMIVLCGLLAACGSQPGLPGQKVGKPYVVDGKTYYPTADDSYDRIGQASWYGPGFHGKYTANGEVFDQNDLTAAHPTLPMPSLVRVTNMENGRSVIVRVNDRGPFKKNRIIDLSRASAKALGVHSLARVRVQFLKAETEQYLASRGWGNVNMAEINEEDRNRARQKELAARKLESPEAQIVESTVSETHAGQTVSDAAPVMMVSSGDISVTDTMPPRKPALIREAAAEEMPVNDPGIRINPNETETETSKPAPEPSAVKIAKPAAVSEASPSASGRFTIQAGSYSSEENASKLASRMGGAATVTKVETGGKTWWRVHVGPFDNRSEAEEALAKVHASGSRDARITGK